METFDGISTEDLAAIRASVADYYQGWCQADATRMKRAVHPALAKRAVVRGPGPDATIGIDESPADQMAEATAAGLGAAYDPAFECVVNHAFRNIATVTMTSAPYTEYLHLARIDGEWRILNALWEPTDSWLAANADAAHWFTDR